MSKEKVLEVLKNAEKPLKAGEIADISGLERKDVDKAMKALKEEGAIVSPKVCYWQAK
jgi:predicted ArsR family transcriptional regulator